MSALPDRATGTAADRARGTAADEAPSVRPYARVGGRTRVPEDLGLSLEALVRRSPEAAAPRSPEEHCVLDLTAARFQTLAELSARLRLPLGVVRVVVADLAERGSVRIHHSERAAGPAAERTVLESILDGIATL